jgi:anti-sigma factor ChrR (cupin superfamily)
MIDPKCITGLLPDGWANMPFEPFHEGVEICRLWQGGPDVALLRYAPGASVPRPRQTGRAPILGLEGSQSDENGRYFAGALVFNPAGTEHSVWSEDGCTSLIQWEKPVSFME